MPASLELLSPSDKPALLGLSQPNSLEVCPPVLTDLGYKVHLASNHSDLTTRFGQAPYQIVILEENFDGASLEQNQSLHALQRMPMTQRRNALFVLIGDSFQTLDAMQAFQQSVHAVVHRSNLANLNQILQKLIAENDLFLSVYRESQIRVAAG